MKTLRAKVITGRHSGQTVVVTNVSTDEMGRQFAACTLSDKTRANISVKDLEVLPEEKEPEPKLKGGKTAGLAFMSGSTGSRSMNQTKSLVRQRSSSPPTVTKSLLAKCEKCGQEFNLEARKGMPGKITECENCAVETETKMEGAMIFSHKTGATIEITKDGELKHEAPIFDPKNK